MNHWLQVRKDKLRDKMTAWLYNMVAMPMDVVIKQFHDDFHPLKTHVRVISEREVVFTAGNVSLKLKW